MNVTLRDVGDADDPFLFDLYAGTRASELALTPWTDDQKRSFLEFQFAAQKRDYLANHPDAAHQIVSVDGEPVGRLYLARRASEIHILDITIAPPRRNAGIGARILQAVLEEAGRAGKPVTIYVEDFNPSQRFFARLGFQVKSVDGFLMLLERPPVISA